MTKNDLLADIAFLIRRSRNAGSWTNDSDRDFGASSNSIVEIAYGLTPLAKQVLPLDLSDLDACERMWIKLPTHRHTSNAIKALDRARHAVSGVKP